ncbi:hypothetical protein F4778DRAFT_728880 [Xylariomycetidae sp. FL2044]|nr:hypothetical protein F4778DRAFT_728880 [Xylariomycetidae sp. FL2044]
MAPNPQPTCAARVIYSSSLNRGWGKALSNETNQMVRRLDAEANAAHLLQLRRDREVAKTAMRVGLFWEHKQLKDQLIVSTPAHLDSLTFFSHLAEERREALAKTKRVISRDFKTVKMHSFFAGLREREFTVLPVEIEDAWVTIVLRVRAKTPITASAPGPDKRGEYLDRELTDFAICDPLEEGRSGRAKRIRDVLPMMLRQGSIEASMTSANDHGNLTPFNVTQNARWETGYVAFAFAREFLRRLKVLLFRRTHPSSDADADTYFLWKPFEEHYTIDGYRQGLMAACLHQCIEKSNYQVRIALEVPSEKAAYSPSSLSRITGPGVVDPPQDLDDEWAATIEKGLTVQTPETCHVDSQSPAPGEPDEMDIDSDDDGELATETATQGSTAGTFLAAPQTTTAEPVKKRARSTTPNPRPRTPLPGKKQRQGTPAPSKMEDKAKADDSSSAFTPVNQPQRQPSSPPTTEHVTTEKSIVVSDDVYDEKQETDSALVENNSEETSNVVNESTSEQQAAEDFLTVPEHHHPSLPAPSEHSIHRPLTAAPASPAPTRSPQTSPPRAPVADMGSPVSIPGLGNLPDVPRVEVTTEAVQGSPEISEGEDGQQQQQQDDSRYLGLGSGRRRSSNPVMLTTAPTPGSSPSRWPPSPYCEEDEEGDEGEKGEGGPGYDGHLYDDDDDDDDDEVMSERGEDISEEMMIDRAPTPGGDIMRGITRKRERDEDEDKDEGGSSPKRQKVEG